MWKIFKAGGFELSTHTDSHPMRVTIRHGEYTMCISHEELKDLMHVTERMMNATRAALPAEKKHEVD
jgi:hypothetical protein